MSCSSKEAMAVITDEEDVSGGKELVRGTKEWAEFSPVKGQVIEVFLAETDIDPAALAWAPFLIVKVTLTTEDASLILECKSLGGLDSETDATLSGLFNRRKGLIHLCVEEPCGHVLGEFYHATRIRWWQGGLAVFKGGSTSCRRQVDKWLNKDDPPEGERLGRERDGFRSPSAKAVPSKTKKAPKAGTTAVPRGGKKEAKTPGKDDEIGTEKKDALLKKLKDLKARLRGPGKTEDGGPPDEPEGPPSPDEIESSSAPDELTTGTSLAVSGVTAAKRKIKERKVDKRKKVSGSELALVASKGSSSKGFQGQLVGQALAVSQTRAEERKKLPSSSSKLGTALTKILTKELHRKKGKKKRKKDKKKKKKKKKKKGGDPDGGGDDDDSSSSPSSSGMTEISEDNSSKSGGSQTSDEELEAPLRKKSKKNPGSVLELLVSHAREQLDQSAAVGVGKEEDHYLTSGIKVMTYFQVLLKPKLGGSQALQREMHHLATAIDLLRQGRLGLLGDTLAARFLCLHQSILDGHWSAARHLEIFPMEESSAASTALLLRTRKHARLAAKAQGHEGGGGGSWNSYGRGVKGKGKQDWHGGDSREYKGKGKKGGKGKGKKGKQNWWQDSDRQGDQEWKDNKESKGDK